jgi:hypothetical protein
MPASIWMISSQKTFFGTLRVVNTNPSGTRSKVLNFVRGQDRAE